MSTSIETTNYSVELTGVIIIPKDNKLIFDIGNLKIAISFVTTEDMQHKDGFKMGLKKDEGNKQYLELEFTNTQDMLFGSLQNPMLEIGMVQGKKLFLQFSIVTLSNGGAKSQMFYYTWLLEKSQEKSTSREGGNSNEQR